MSTADPDGVRTAYDTLAEAYAARLPDTRADTASDLARAAVGQVRG